MRIVEVCFNSDWFHEWRDYGHGYSLWPWIYFRGEVQCPTEGRYEWVCIGPLVIKRVPVDGLEWPIRTRP